MQHRRRWSPLLLLPCYQVGTSKVPISETYCTYRRKYRASACYAAVVRRSSSLLSFAFYLFFVSCPALILPLSSSHRHSYSARSVSTPVPVVLPSTSATLSKSVRICESATPHISSLRLLSGVFHSSLFRNFAIRLSHHNNILNMDLKPDPRESLKQAAPTLSEDGPLDLPIEAPQKGRWERAWPTIACGAGLFSDGYLNGVCVDR